MLLPDLAEYLEMSARTCKGAGGGIHACYWHPGLELHPISSSLKSCNWKPPSYVWQCPDSPFLHRNHSPKSLTASCWSGPVFFPHLPAFALSHMADFKKWTLGLWHLVSPRFLPSCHQGPHLFPPTPSFPTSRAQLCPWRECRGRQPHCLRAIATACPGASSLLHWLLSWLRHPHTILQALHLMSLSTRTEPPCAQPS